jgi:hypothetical protein
MVRGILIDIGDNLELDRAGVICCLALPGVAV